MGGGCRATPTSGETLPLRALRHVVGQWSSGWQRALFEKREDRTALHGAAPTESAALPLRALWNVVGQWGRGRQRALSKKWDRPALHGADSVNMRASSPGFQIDAHTLPPTGG